MIPPLGKYLGDQVGLEPTTGQFMSPCTVVYTVFHQVILTNINSILTVHFTNTKCY